MGWQTTGAGMFLLLGFALTTAHAETERSFVVAGGGDAAVYASDDGGERSTAGYFARLSWETPVPDYTTASTGYVWNFGIDPDVEFSRAWSEDSRLMTMLEAGLRLSVPFSQKRMGLLGISARGGFWVGVRGGITSLGSTSLGSTSFGDAPPQPGPTSPVGPQQGGGPSGPDTSKMLLDLSVGEFFLLGDSGLRLEFELSSLMTDDPEVLDGADFGLRMRAGLGAYF